jgi:transposase
MNKGGKVKDKGDKGKELTMPAKKYIVDLTSDEGEALLGLMSRGQPSARTVTRARILLKADEGLIDRDIARALNTSTATVEQVRQRFVEGGLDNALNERPRPGQRRKLDGAASAYVIAIACSAAPEGHQRWTLRLLADKVVELGLAESISHETIRGLLKKTR